MAKGPTTTQSGVAPVTMPEMFKREVLHKTGWANCIE